MKEKRGAREDGSGRKSGEVLSGSGVSAQSRNSGQQVIQYEKYHLSLTEGLFALAKGIGLCGLVAWTFYRSLVAFLILLPAGLCYPFYERRRLKEKRILTLASQFKESMVILASALSAGYSIENALRVSQEELVTLYGEEGMITREFSCMNDQIRMNRSVEQVLEDFAQRSGIEDIQNFSEVFSVAKRSGGDLSGIMRHTAEMIRDKMQVKEEIRTMTASRKFEQKIMNLIPFFIVFYVDGASPGFFKQMYQTMAGRVLMSGCLAVYLISVWMAGRILEIEV
ncbi:type II secretion system F family protein [Brotaphodocola sp.]|uniref:type II secretion system F family protein n=1 Tax=Brotaphodocola sp. TaxID=3073577 RepID=UPI003D7CC473